jgi:hypothetical protein
MVPALFPLVFDGHSCRFFRLSKGRSGGSLDEGTSCGVQWTLRDIGGFFDRAAGPHGHR